MAQGENLLTCVPVPILDSLIEGAYIVDSDFKIVYWNKAAESITGFSKDDVIGRKCSDYILIHLTSDGKNACVKNCPMKKSASCGRKLQDSMYLRHKQGHRVPVLIKTVPITQTENASSGVLELFSVIPKESETKKEVERLRKIAMLDNLTGIGNRRLFDLNFSSKLNELSRFKISFALLFADIDKFKLFNDQYGHPVGDRVIKMIANTISENIRSIDSVCRWGGEEYVILLSNVNKEQMIFTAEKLRNLISASSFAHRNSVIRAAVSIGAVFVNKKSSKAALLRKADKLMFKCKSAGGNCVTAG